MKDILVDVYVLCYNEERLIPFMLDYWNEFATNVYVLDNHSTDHSIELLKQETRFNIEIIPYESNNELNDSIYTDLKNNVWKKSKGKCDFVVVCDLDEALYSPNIMDELKYMKKNWHTLCYPTIFDMYSPSFPEYKKGELLHNIVKTGLLNGKFGKRLLFSPNYISEINYSPGAHECKPTGHVNYYNGYKMFMFHCKNLSIDYVFEKHKMYLERMSEINKEEGWGSHYTQTYEQIKTSIDTNLLYCDDITKLLN